MMLSGRLFIILFIKAGNYETSGKFRGGNSNSLRRRMSDLARAHAAGSGNH
jgi:hypothetical protein